MNIINLLKNDFTPDRLKEQFAIDILMGLSSSPKRIAPKYFYNDQGSELFQKITESNEYYLTKAEFEILKKNARKIAVKVKESTPIIDIIELGAGDGKKTTVLVNALAEAGVEINYYPIDISKEAMEQMKDYHSATDKFSITGVVAEYFQGLNYLKGCSSHPKMLLFLGSNIGNFNRQQAAEFMHRVWRALNSNDWLLLGADLKKETDILHSAYNDAGGITRKFNLNLLTRINSELGGEFDIDTFDHYGSYNPLLGAMESFLLSKQTQSVYIRDLQKEFKFKALEPIHMEYSTKYLDDELTHMGESSGYVVEESYYDEKKWYSNYLFRVVKS